MPPFAIGNMPVISLVKSTLVPNVVVMVSPLHVMPVPSTSLQSNPMSSPVNCIPVPAVALT